MRCYKIYQNILLVGTLLSSPIAIAGDQDQLSTDLVASFILPQTPSCQTITPHRTLLQEFSIEFPPYLYKEASKNLKDAAYIGKKLYREGWESLIGDSVEVFLNSVNKRFLTKHLHHKGDNSEEFDPEALRPLFEQLRNSLCSMIEYFCLRGSLVGYDPVTQQSFQTYQNKSVYRLLTEKLIPDAIPLKRLFIALTDCGPIREYLEYKTDEMIINGILQVYKTSSGVTVKQSINRLVHSLTHKTPPPNTQNEEDIRTQSEKGKEKIPIEIEELDPLLKDSLPENSKNCDLMPLEQDTPISFSPTTSLQSSATLKQGSGYSHLWAYFAPQLAHFFRLTFSHILKPMSESALNETNNKALKGFLQNNLLITSTKAVGFGVGYGLASFATGGSIPWDLGIGCIGTYLSGWMVSKATEFALNKTKDRIKSNLFLLMDYYSYRLIPLTRSEHALYNLNLNPTPEEYRIFAEDYQLRDKLTQTSFLGELIRDVAALSQGIFDYLFDKAEELGGHIKKFLNYCRGSSESTQAILETVSLEETCASKRPQAARNTKKTDLLSQIILGKIAEKLGQHQPLTDHETLVWSNVLQYPSFEIRQQALNLIDLRWNNQKHLSEALHQLNQAQDAIRPYLTQTYKTWGEELPCQLASAYQDLSFHYCLDPRFDATFSETVDIFAASIQATCDSLSPEEQTLWGAAIRDNDFLRDYLEEFITTHEIPQQVAEDEDQATTILRDPRLIKGLPSAYAIKQQEAYVNQYEQELKTFQQSRLGIDLSFAEIIDLHQRMTDEQKQLYITPMHSLSEEVLRPEFERIKGLLEAAINQDLPYMVKFYKDDFLKQYNLQQFVEEHLSEVPSDDSRLDRPDVKQEDYERFYEQFDRLFSLDQIKRAVAHANWLKSKILDHTEPYQQFKAGLQKVIPQNGNFRTQVYTQITHHLLREILEKREQEKSREEWIVVLQPAKKLKDLTPGDGLTMAENLTLHQSLGAGGTIPQIPQVNKPTFIIQGADQSQTITIYPYTNIYSTNSADFTTYRLCKIVNSLRQEGMIADVTQLSTNDLKAIHNAIQEEKLHSSSEWNQDALLFAQANLGELIAFKNTWGNQHQALFYTYRDVYDAMIKANRKTVAKIKQQPKKAS